MIAFAETLLSLSSRSHNRPQLIEARVPTALCILVLSTLAAIYPDTIPIVISTAEALVAPDRAASSRAQPAEPTSSGFIASHPHFKKSALHHISGIISQSLNALSYFLDDEFTITASGSGLNNPAVPPLVEMLCHRHMMTAFNFALGSLSARKEARLACLRVVSCLSEWSASIDALMESRFSDGLLRICSSDEDAALSTTSHSAAHPQSHHHSTAAGGGLKIPTLERESTGGSSIHSVSIRMGFDDDQEETISACYILVPRHKCLIIGFLTFLLFTTQCLGKHVSVKVRVCGAALQTRPPVNYA